MRRAPPPDPLEHAERRPARLGGERGRDVDGAERVDEVGRRRALAEQDDVVRARQRRARGRSRPPRPRRGAGRRAGGTRAGRRRRGRRAAARARPPRRSRSAAGRRASSRSAHVRCRTSASCSGVRRSRRAQELRPRPERVQAQVLRRRLLGGAVEAARRRGSARSAAAAARTRAGGGDRRRRHAKDVLRVEPAASSRLGQPDRVAEQLARRRAAELGPRPVEPREHARRA